MNIITDRLLMLAIALVTLGAVVAGAYGIYQTTVVTDALETADEGKPDGYAQR